MATSGGDSFEGAVKTARAHIPISARVQKNPQGFHIHRMDDGSHRVYDAAPQAPGGLLPSSPRPGVPVAHVGMDGSVSIDLSEED